MICYNTSCPFRSDYLSKVSSALYDCPCYCTCDKFCEEPMGVNNISIMTPGTSRNYSINNMLEQSEEPMAELLFKELGYQRFDFTASIVYEEEQGVIIAFNLIEKIIHKCSQDGSFADITMDELRAVNKQIKELGW